MKEKVELVRFNLTQEMSLELIRFNNMKKEFNELKKLYNLDKNKKLLLQINKLEKELVKSKNKFIKEFSENNKEEIEKYLKIKDQIWSFFHEKKEIEKFCRILIIGVKINSSFVESV